MQSDANHSPRSSSLLNRELTGNFCVFGPKTSLARSKRAGSTKAFSADSLLSGTGNFIHRTGNSFSRSGNFQGGAGNLSKPQFSQSSRRFESSRGLPRWLRERLKSYSAERKRLPFKSERSLGAKVESEERNAETSVSSGNSYLAGPRISIPAWPGVLALVFPNLIFF